MISYNTFKRSKIGLLTQNIVKENEIDYGESITDKSKYNPNVSSFIANQGNLQNVPLYHFSDGVDNGLRMSVITNKYFDQTERDEVYDKLKNSTSEQIEKLYERLEEEESSSDDDNVQTTNNSSNDSNE